MNPPKLNTVIKINKRITEISHVGQMICLNLDEKGQKIVMIVRVNTKYLALIMLNQADQIPPGYPIVVSGDTKFTTTTDIERYLNDNYPKWGVISGELTIDLIQYGNHTLA